MSLEDSGNNFETERLTHDWGEMQPRNYRRPIAERLNPLEGAGFMIERFLEPTPDPTFKSVDSEKYEQLTTVLHLECDPAAN